MREILFRGKHIHGLSQNEHLNERWIYGYLCDKNYIYSPELEGEFLINPETVCQYTGHKDNTGKRIFEGDIVAFEDMTSTGSGYSEMGCCGEVGYDEEEACFYVTNRLSAESWEVLGECHIIGNIFDNPELIGDQT